MIEKFSEEYRAKEKLIEGTYFDILEILEREREKILEARKRQVRKVAQKLFKKKDIPLEEIVEKGIDFYIEQFETKIKEEEQKSKEAFEKHIAAVTKQRITMEYAKREEPLEEEIERKLKQIYREKNE